MQTLPVVRWWDVPHYWLITYVSGPRHYTSSLEYRHTGSCAVPPITHSSSRSVTCLLPAGAQGTETTIFRFLMPVDASFELVQDAVYPLPTQVLPTAQVCKSRVLAKRW